MGRVESTAMTPFRIAGIYVVLGMLWVLGSDWILAELFTSRTLGGTAQTLKSTVFIVASGAIVFGLARHQLQQIKDQAAAIHTSSETIESLAEASPHPIVQLDLEGKVTRWNQAAEELFGWSQDEILGRELPFVPPDATDEVANNIAKVAQGNTIEHQEIIRQDKAGNQLHLDLSASPVRDHDGAIVSIVAVLVDIGEYKEREALLEELIEGGEDIMVGTSAADVCEQTITTATDVLELPLAGIWLYNEDKSHLEPFGLSEEAKTVLEDQPVFEQGSSIAWETYERGESHAISDMQSVDGVYNPESVIESELLIPIGDHGILISGSTTARDFTGIDRHRAELLASFTNAALDRVDREQALAAEQQFTDAAINTLRDVFIVIDAETGRLEHWNQQLQETTARSEEELDALPLKELMVESDVKTTEHALREAVQTGSVSVELGIKTSEGSVRTHEFRGRRLNLPGDDRELVVAIGRDVTDQRQLERALRENERRYRTLVEMSPSPIVVHADSDVVYANDAFLSLVNAADEQEVVGRSIAEFVPEEDVEDVLQRARATQSGEEMPTQLRHKLGTDSGNIHHIESTSRPIAYEGQAAVLTVVENITDRVRHEQRLRQLHETTRELLEAESTVETVTEAARACGPLLDLPDAVVFEYNEAAGQLVPSIAAEGSEAYVADLEAVERGDYTPVWHAFVAGESQRLTDSSAALPFTDGVLLPLGTFGVLVAGTTRGTSVSDETMDLAEILRRNLEATLSRLEREATLQERDRELAQQNKQLQRLTQLDSIIRGVNRALFTSATREEIERAVCSELAAAEVFAGVWIGEDTGRDVVPVCTEGLEVNWTGDGNDPLQAVAREALHQNKVVIAEDIVVDQRWQARRSHALDHGYQVVAAVPIPIRGDVERVLVLHSSEEALFTDGTREVFEELGLMIGNALETVGGRASVGVEEFTEIEVQISDPEFVFNQLVTLTGGGFELRGAIPDEDEVRVFLSSSVDAEAIETVVNDMDGVRLIQTEGDATKSKSMVILALKFPILNDLAGLGASVRTLTADDSGSALTVTVPKNLAVRDVIDTIERRHDAVELLARHDTTTSIQTPETILAALEAMCTERQLEALRAAYYGGYYEWPREATNQALADTLGIASATYQSHRRTAERKLIESVLQ